MEVLFVSDDLPLSQAVRRTLESSGYGCALMTGDGRALDADPEHAEPARRQALETEPELVIVDDATRGWTSERFDTLMAQYPQARSLLLTQSSSDGKSSPSDEDGLKPDATLRMPFSNAELLAHVASLGSNVDASRLLIHGDLTLNLADGHAYYGENRKPLPLSPREFSTLKTLIEADGRFLSFDELGKAVCGTGFFGYHDIMNNVLYSLTRKLRRLGFFVTQRDNSYRIL